MLLSKPQKLIYDMEKYAGGSIGTVCGVLFASGETDEETAIACIRRICAMHPALRLSLDETGTAPELRISDDAAREIPVLRFDSEAEMLRFCQAQAARPFAPGELLSAFTVMLLPGKTAVLARMDHMAADAWSLALIGAQFMHLIRGETPESGSCERYLAQETAYLASARFEKDRRFFAEQLAGFHDFVYLSSRPSQSFEVARIDCSLDPALRREVRAYAAARGVSEMTVYAGAFSAVFGKFKMNAGRLYIGAPVLNRFTAQDMNTVGMFVNTVPVLIEPDYMKSFAENLDAVEDAFFSAFRHQRFNAADIKNEWRAQGGGGEDLYDVLFDYQEAPADLADAGCEILQLPCGMQLESMQFHMENMSGGEGLRVHIDYRTQKLAEYEARAFFTAFVACLRSALACGDAALKDRKIAGYAEGMEIVKTIFVPNRLLNLILRPKK